MRRVQFCQIDFDVKSISIRSTALINAADSILSNRFRCQIDFDVEYLYKISEKRPRYGTSVLSAIHLCLRYYFNTVHVAECVPLSHMQCALPHLWGPTGDRRENADNKTETELHTLEQDELESIASHTIRVLLVLAD